MERGGTRLYTSAIPVLRRLRQEDQHEFKASLAYVARPISKTRQHDTANEQPGHILLITRLLFTRELKPDPTDSLSHSGFNALPTSIPESYRKERQALCARWHALTLWDCLQRIPADDWMGCCVQNASSSLTGVREERFLKVTRPLSPSGKCKH